MKLSKVFVVTVEYSDAGAKIVKEYRVLSSSLPVAIKRGEAIANQVRSSMGGTVIIEVVGVVECFEVWVAEISGGDL